MKDFEVKRILMTDETARIREMQLSAPEFSRHYPKHAEWLDKAIDEVLYGIRVAFGIFKYGLAHDRGVAVEILGSIILKENKYTGVIELKNLYVGTGERLNGYGRAMHKKVVEYSAKAGYSAIQTEVPCDEIGTISFLLKMGYQVVDIEPSPYRDDESIYNMRCAIPPFYNGDVYDLRAQALWTLKNYYAFIDKDDREDLSMYKFTATRSRQLGDFAHRKADINGVAYIIDERNPLSKNDLNKLIENDNAHLRLIFTNHFQEDALAFGDSLGLKLFDAKKLTETFSERFAYGSPQFECSEITGMIVEIKPELFDRIASKGQRFSYFKGGPSGKFLKKGQFILFHLDPTPGKPRNGICGFARIDSVDIGSADDVWRMLEKKSPLFTPEEYVRFSRSKKTIVGFELSAFEEINDISIVELPRLLKLPAEELEEIGHRYTDAEIIEEVFKRRKGGVLMNEKEYDVALTFAGEDRKIAEELAAKLTAAGVSVFYDKYEKASLWGEDLYLHLQTVYRDRARFCLLLISKYYPEKAWPRHELKQAQARAFREKNAYILPLRLDDTVVPGLNETIGHIDLRKESMDTVVELLREKLNK